MFGCLKRVVGFVFLLAMLGGLYVTRHRWVPLVTPAGRDVIAELDWQPLTTEGAARARRIVTQLERPDGAVFANLAVADLASFLLDSLVQGISDGTRTAQAVVRDDRILLRTQVKVSDFGPEYLPLIGGVADRSAMLTIGGRLRVDRPGLGEWIVDELIIDAVAIPGPAVPRLTRVIATRLRRAGTRDDALGFSLPGHIGDVRVRPGTITLYKAVVE
jgi:hypothetical protein